jgi:hypothetical protein
MAHGAGCCQGLADRCEAIASSMTAKRNRDTVANLAARYLWKAAEARRLERGAEQLQQNPPPHVSIRFQSRTFATGL